MDDRDEGTSLGRWGTALLLTYCLLFFGLSLVGGRPLTMHEGVLPETAREMSLDHDWIIPKNGGRPWMENPPLPQWITVAIGACLGGCDRVWVTRIGPALAATLAVWLTARMAARWFGRGVGLLSGMVLATTYEFTQYAWLAEDEIFLCALCTLAIHAFVVLEFDPRGQVSNGGFQPLGGRPAAFLWLFVAVGLTNLAKGLMFGPVMVGVPMAGYLLWNRDWRRISHYLWAWGFLTFAVIMLAWPIAAMWRLPEVVDLWHYDHVGRLDGSYVDLTEPWWYYLKVLPTNLAPWTLLVPLAFWSSSSAAWRERASPERFLWCWAVLPVVVFSIPTGKHHHYLLHCTAPFSVLVARALPLVHAQIQSWPKHLRNPWNSLATLVVPGEVALWLWGHKLPGGGAVAGALMLAWPLLVVWFSWSTAQPSRRLAAAGLLSTVTLGFVGGHVLAGRYVDQCIEDTVFLRQIPQHVPPQEPVLVNADLQCLDEFRIQFYLGARSRVLHNLTFLADDQLANRVYLVTRAEHEPLLNEYGSPTLLSQSLRSRREKDPGRRLSLYQLDLRSDLPRHSTTGIKVTPMQSQSRAPGPFLGSHVESALRD